MINIPNIALGGYDSVGWESSSAPKDSSFDYQSGHMSWLAGLIPGRECRRQPTDVMLIHGCFSLLPSSLSKNQ